jgi:hypothetical protein
MVGLARICRGTALDMIVYVTIWVPGGHPVSFERGSSVILILNYLTRVLYLVRMVSLPLVWQ